MNKNKTKTKRKYLILLLLFIFICIELNILFSINKDKVIYTNGVSDRLLSTNQETLDYSKNINLASTKESYTEIVGYGLITLDLEHPFIYLINPKDNDVYLSFDVYCDDVLLHTGALISPGNMECFDIYSCLNAGKHTLIYKINSYDLNTKQTYWKGINQKQDIQINK